MLYCYKAKYTSVLCKTLFVSKSELGDLRTELLFKLSELKEEVKTHTYHRCQPPNLALTSPCISSPHSTPVAADLQVSASTSVSSEVNLSYPSSQKNESSLKNPSGVSSTENQAVDNNKSQRTNSRNVVIVGDSLLHRIQINKMKVGNIPAVKLTKREDTLSNAISRCGNFAGRHSDRLLDVVLLTGTNDLSDRRITPEKLIDKLYASLTELKQFSNVNQIFIRKIPARFDFQSINHKVSQFNQLLFERFRDTEEFLNVIETIPSEFRFYHHDGLHMSNFGLTKLCGIIMSHLYKTLAPTKYKTRNPVSHHN